MKYFIARHNSMYELRYGYPSSPLIHSEHLGSFKTLFWAKRVAKRHVKLRPNGPHHFTRAIWESK